MSTLVVSPRPEMRAEDAGTRQPVLASSFQRAWETVGNSYEQLTVGPAPNNGARTVPAPHDHTNGKVGSGITVAQAPLRWQGLSRVGDTDSRASTFPFALTYLYVWAGIVQVYTNQECAVAIFGNRGNGGGANLPGSIADALVLEINGFQTPFGFERSNGDSWFIAAGLGVIAPGTYHLALKVTSLNGTGETWSVIGAEVWPSQNSQMVLPP
tara:strand:- start:4316 stop:4951 length:636 start_codon:yes stop_codon:yes gene_type:complete